MEKNTLDRNFVSHDTCDFADIEKLEAIENLNEVVKVISSFGCSKEEAEKTVQVFKKR